MEMVDDDDGEESGQASSSASPSQSPRGRQAAARHGRMEDVVCYCNHFENLDADPHDNDCEKSSYGEVRDCHVESADRLSRDPSLKPPTLGQDIDKTLQIYEDFLYPTMAANRLVHLVEDNVSPHNSNRIRQRHEEHGVQIVGYGRGNGGREG